MFRENFQIPAYPTLVKGNFLKQQSSVLAAFDHLTKSVADAKLSWLPCPTKRFPCPNFNGKFTCLKVCAIQIGDLQLLRPKLSSCSGARLVIEKIQTRDCKIGFGIQAFLP